ncbi:MAG: InlB B-repeat-containing protein, partial [Oscillospiraceae bacterium]|nr:InlB B-repeat-containing protein [Oscillospiraceae bacterium]
ATYSGGGINNSSSAALELESGTIIRGNRSDAMGGGAWSGIGLTASEGVVIQGNYSKTGGGGISARAVNLDGADIRYNISDGNGGGVQVRGGSSPKATIDAQLYNNVSNAIGDDLYFPGGELHLSPVGDGWVLEETSPDGDTLNDCSDTIDGWYADGAYTNMYGETPAERNTPVTTRWSAHGEAVSAVLVEGKMLDFTGGPAMALKAAHGAVTVTVDPNGGAWEGSEEPTVFAKQPFNESKELAEPTRTGYSFTGWTVTKGADDAATKLDGSSLSWGTHDVTVQAQWELNEYTVTYDPNGGTMADGAASATETVTYNETAKGVKDPIREAYTFNGWYVDKEGTTPYAFSTPVTEDITLYAIWNVNEYTIIYDPNGGVWSDGTTTTKSESHPVTEGARILAAPTREGYTFIEWKGSSYQPGEDYNEKDEKGLYVSDTLTAQWEEIAKPTPTPAPTSSPSPAPENSPKTGDTADFLRLGILVSFALLGGGLTVIYRRKKAK